MTDPPDVALIVPSYVLTKLELLTTYKLRDSVLITSGEGFPNIVHNFSPFSGDFWPLSNEKSEWGEQWELGHTLDGAVIEALARAWGVGLKDVLAYNDLSPKNRKSVTIATEGEREIKQYATQVSRPK